uniref:Uncharacterized protein n=1 Tax=Syphacia muris TaxID=451379 RepID=A0A0N5AE26_9BILA
MKPWTVLAALLLLGLCAKSEIQNGFFNMENYSRTKRGQYLGGNYGLSSTYGTEYDLYDSILPSAEAIPIRQNRGHHLRYNDLLKKPLIAARMVRPRLF